MSIPTIEELFERYRKLIDNPEMEKHLEAFEIYFSCVASGKKKPLLTLNNAVLAAQTVLVVLEHVKKNRDVPKVQHE